MKRIAKVKMFDQVIREFEVIQEVFTPNGDPVRLFCKNAEGIVYKFKICEEPWTILWVPND